MTTYTIGASHDAYGCEGQITVTLRTDAEAIAAALQIADRAGHGWSPYAYDADGRVLDARYDLGTLSGSSLSETERCGLASAGHADDTGVSPSPRRA